jgi:hypothetical protein
MNTLVRRPWKESMQVIPAPIAYIQVVVFKKSKLEFKSILKYLVQNSTISPCLMVRMGLVG